MKTFGSQCIKPGSLGSQWVHILSPGNQTLSHLFHLGVRSYLNQSIHMTRADKIILFSDRRENSSAAEIETCCAGTSRSPVTKSDFLSYFSHHLHFPSHYIPGSIMKCLNVFISVFRKCLSLCVCEVHPCSFLCC